MRSIKTWFLVLCVCSVNALLHECGEFNKQGSSPRPFVDRLETNIDDFDVSDFSRMREAFDLLQNISANTRDEVLSTANLIKYVPDRIRLEGYPAETHEVTTEDGYILELHRIPYGRKSPISDKPKPPVYMMHAFEESSNGWIVLGPNNSLAYLLADAGYDVWMGNARGTEPSRKHVNLSPDGFFQKKYWSFTWHEIGYYDLPASIDYILAKTKFERLNYVGFSQGTISFFVMASTRTEYNHKIVEANLLAPVATLQGMRNPFYNTFANFYKPLKMFSAMNHIYKIDVDNRLALRMASIACGKAETSTPYTCKYILMPLNSNQINCTSLPSILVGTPSGASFKLGFHYIQLIRNGGFRQFDYESRRMNRKMYGTSKPPDYDLSEVTTPIHIYHSKDDDTSVFENVIELETQLPNVKSRYLVPVADFGHVDFIYSRYAREAINDKLISTINNANPSN